MKSETSYADLLSLAHHAFEDRALIRVKKSNGIVLGPGYIAIMYGQVAFRLYPKDVTEGSHFVRLEDVVEVLVDQDEI